MSNIPLSKEQKKIVNSDATNIIVAAGAGSGKTRVLTERVKRLLQSGVNPHSIVVITFTNMAAEELKERLQGVPNAHNCFIGTIHSLANTLLSTQCSFEIYDQEIQDSFMEFLINHYSVHSTYDDYDTLMDAFRQMKAGTCSYDTVVKGFKPQVFDELLIFLGYNQKHNTLDYANYPQDVLTLCKVNNVITFDELLIKCRDYFKEHNAFIDYLFVDELQDIGNLEYDFLMELDAKHNFFIGDDYQAIYKFKGGDVSIFLSLLEDDDWTSYYLEDNYRNGAVILQFANGIISKAKDIIIKNSVCKSGKLGSVDIKSKNDFATFLQQFVDDDTDLKDWFILVRKNSDLFKVLKMLRARNIPTVTFKNSEISKAEKDAALEQNAVKLLTIHMAKGLESKNVAMYGSFPVNPTAHTKSDEIKILYVGITRTEEQLLIFNGK